MQELKAIFFKLGSIISFLIYKFSIEKFKNGHVWLMSCSIFLVPYFGVLSPEQVVTLIRLKRSPALQIHKHNNVCEMKEERQRIQKEMSSLYIYF